MTIPPLSFKVISQEEVDRENAETPKLLENAVGDNFRFCQMKLGCVTPRSEAEKKRWLSDTKKIQQLERDWTEIKSLKDLVAKEDFVDRIDTLIRNLTIFRDARKSLFEETPIIGSPRDPDNSRRFYELQAINSIIQTATKFKES
jgi:hypothetical protein